MAQIRIYNQETNGYYNIDFNLQQAISDTTATGDLDCYLIVSTNIPTLSGGTFPKFKVTDLGDVPPDQVENTATDFNELCQWYYEYFTVTAQLAQSSTSSSSSSSEGYSSSSSEGYSTSSSSSSEGYSTSSSSSSEGYSTSSSSSSEGYSTSSSSSSDSTDGL